MVAALLPKLNLKTTMLDAKYFQRAFIAVRFGKA